MLQAVHAIMRGCGASFHSQVDDELVQLVLKSLNHPNRFVREVSYHITATICELLAGASLRPYAPLIAQHLRNGLSENWSQVHFSHDLHSSSVLLIHAAVHSCCLDPQVPA